MNGISRKIELITPEGEKLVCRVADTFWSRFFGLMGKHPPPQSEGLLIRPCNSIHMFFMKFAIDAVFLDENFRVVRVIKHLVPGKVVSAVPEAWQVVEVESGKLPDSVMVGIYLSAE